MTLREMAVEYRVNCALLHQRMAQLRAVAQRETDPGRAQELCQRLADLTTLYREGRELAHHMEHYYDRGYRKNGKFTF